MHGPGFPPPQGPTPTSGGVVALRVLFALLPILSCGFLAWGTILRLAVVTRRIRDWVLLGVSFLLVTGWITLIGLDETPDTNGWQGNTGAGGIILTGVATCVYFLIADIRHYEAKAAAGPWYPGGPAPYRTGPPQQHTRGYGYPPAPQHQTGPQQQPVPQQPPAGPTPPPRIGQVRAELDELSELLRNQPPRDQDPNR